MIRSIFLWIMATLLLACGKKPEKKEVILTHADSIERGLNRVTLIQQSNVSLQHYMPRADYGQQWKLLVIDLAEAKRKNKEVMAEASTIDKEAHLQGVDMTQVMSEYNKRISVTLKVLNPEQKKAFFKSLDSLNRVYGG